MTSSKKKNWQFPKLVILTRGKPEIKALAICKILNEEYPNSGPYSGTGGHGCAMVVNPGPFPWSEGACGYCAVLQDS